MPGLMGKIHQPVGSRHAEVAMKAPLPLTSPVPRQSRSQAEADVIVIGAGLAGLNATMLLEQAGLRVALVEARDHVGGRMLTLDDLPGRPDAGGIQVGPGYARFHAIADRLGVERFVPTSSEGGSLYHIGGATITAGQWPSAAQNVLARGEKWRLPDLLLFSFLEGLPSLDLPTQWMDAQFSAFDVPLLETLKACGASDQAIRLIDANLNGYSVATLSTLHVLRTLAIFRGARGPVQFVRGGSQRMTDAMAAALKTDVQLDSPVAAITAQKDGTRITLINGRQISAAHCICTVPFAALREIKISAGLPSPVNRMIANLPYTHATFAYIAASEPFWRSDGFAETLWSDDPMIGRIFVLGDEPAMLKAWLNGPAADRIDSMDPVTAGVEIIRRIESARPSAKGKLQLLRMYSWQKDRYARGIYHHIGAGQAADLAAAARYTGHRLHFAGEHLAQTSSGIEGALESGERAARAVLAS